MFIIQKITQRYHPEQDRVSFSVENVEQKVLLLWLTQRLANRLVGILVSWLAEDSQTVSITQSSSDLRILQQVPTQQMQQTQQAQQTQGTVVSAVDAAVAQSEVLLDTIDLARDQHGAYVLTFNWTENNARLILSATELRQWLNILNRLFDTAEWPKHVWSEWFAVNNEMSSARPHLLH